LLHAYILSYQKAPAITSNKLDDIREFVNTAKRTQ